MEQYRVVHLVENIEGLRNLEEYMARRCETHGRDVPTKVGEHPASLVTSPVIEACKGQCTLLEMVAPVRRLAEMRSQLFVADMTNDDVRVQLQEARKDICLELEDRRFAYIPLQRAMKHDSLAKDWHRVLDAFPESADDISDGMDCYAIGLYTATVFHATRIAETGIRSVAKRLRVKLTDKKKRMPIEFGTWDSLITGIRNKIDAAHKLPKSVRREKQLNFYSNIADHCGYMKDLWRNPVSHARVFYNEGEALGALERVRGFMLTVAEGMGKSK
jgi:hypothetical protein